MKREVKVEIFLKGAELIMNGQVNKAPFYPPLVSEWRPLTGLESFIFKIGRKEYALTVERLYKTKGRKRHGE